MYSTSFVWALGSISATFHMHLMIHTMNLINGYVRRKHVYIFDKSTATQKRKINTTTGKMLQSLLVTMPCNLGHIVATINNQMWTWTQSNPKQFTLIKPKHKPNDNFASRAYNHSRVFEKKKKPVHYDPTSYTNYYDAKKKKKSVEKQVNA